MDWAFKSCNQLNIPHYVKLFLVHLNFVVVNLELVVIKLLFQFKALTVKTGRGRGSAILSILGKDNKTAETHKNMQLQENYVI